MWKDQVANVSIITCSSNISKWLNIGSSTQQTNRSKQKSIENLSGYADEYMLFAKMCKQKTQEAMLSNR